MNRIERLFAILLKLQAHGRQTAHQLGSAFGVSKRTVYRDIAALNEMGVPIVSLPGEGYELMPGYYLPPLIFAEAEAAALVLGAHLLATHTTGVLPAGAQTAVEKLRAALPDRTLREVDSLRQITTFGGPENRFDLDDPLLRLMAAAIHTRHVVEIDYHSLARNENTQRRIEPLTLHYDAGVWYVNAYCRLRQGMRAFRFNRISAYRSLDERFQPRELQPENEPTEIEVVVAFPADQARWVRERLHYSFVREEPTAVAHLFFFKVKRLDELRSWLLSWGAAARVRQPPELQALLQAEITMMQHNYS